MCHRCDQYADERAAADEPAPEAVPKQYHGHDQSARNSVRCEGCGERIEYNDLVRYDEAEDQWWHQGCEDDR